MERVGIRELKQHASAVLRRVQRGEALEVTDRGRAVALLVPIREPADPIARLVETGAATEPSGDLAALPAPMEPARDRPPPSAVLAEMRAHER
ncbi:MAG: type II toxin-antitoxin system prevent-host-death family antitoxin [Acidimicrobiia bacterium]|nr:type II toxin-antitoxin system prevent-host-death family antitoxin [Acidimicrobiia bacterium]